MSVQAKCFVFLCLILPGSALFAQSSSSIPPDTKPLEKISPLKVITLSDYARQAAPVITALDIDPSGEQLAMGGDNHIVHLWDVGPKWDIDTKRDIVTRRKQELREQIEWVRGIAFCDDYVHMVIVGQDGKMEIHNIQSEGHPPRTIIGRDSGMQAVACRKGGKEFAVCGFPNKVSIYNISTGQLVRTLEAHGTSNRAIRYSPDGSRLVVAGRTGIIRVWDAVTGEVVHELPGDGWRINALAFNSSGNRLAAAGDGPNITIWNMENGKRSVVLPERTGKTYSLAFCGDHLLASGEGDNVIRFWDLELKSPIASADRPEGHHGTIAALVYKPKKYEEDKEFLISGSFDATVRFWPIPK